MKVRTVIALSLILLGILPLFPERNRSQGRASDKSQTVNVITTSVNQDSLRITFDQWNQCLSFRTAKSSDCLKEIAQDLSRTVAAGLSGPDWSKEELTLSYPLVDRFVDDGAVKCGEPKDKVRTALQLNLLSCPL
jgi:hypothetical protein